jgi:hypothetical protein
MRPVLQLQDSQIRSGLPADPEQFRAWFSGSAVEEAPSWIGLLQQATAQREGNR